MITTYQDLPVGVMLKLAALDDRHFEDDLERQVAIIAILSGETEDAVLSLPLDEYTRRVVASRFLDGDFPQRLPQRSYKVGPFELVPVRDMRKVTTAQFVDFKTFADQGSGTAFTSKTVEMLSCMLVPKGHTYCEGYDPLDVQAAIRDHLRADDAVALSAFFLASWMKSSKRILISSRREARRLKSRQTLEKIRTLLATRRALTRGTPTRRNGDG